jgi:hypothetical protein
MKVSGLFHAPAALPPDKEPPIPTRQEVRWAQKQVLEAVGEQKNSLLCQESKPVVQPVA